MHQRGVQFDGRAARTQKAFKRARTHVFDEYVGAPQQRAEIVATRGALKIDGDDRLVGVGHGEEVAHVALARLPEARGIAFRRLDLDHFCAERCEVLRDERCGRVLTDFDDANATQRGFVAGATCRTGGAWIARGAVAFDGLADVHLERHPGRARGGVGVHRTVTDDHAAMQDVRIAGKIFHADDGAAGDVELLAAIEQIQCRKRRCPSRHDRIKRVNVRDPIGHGTKAGITGERRVDHPR